MKITLKGEGICGNVILPPGDYWVAPLLESGSINLVGQGKDYCLKATRRRAKVQAKSIGISFTCGGGITWSLVVVAPKLGEWVALIDVHNKKD